MTGKDFNMIAEVFQETRPKTTSELRQWDLMLIFLIDRLKENRNFDVERFYRAVYK